MRVRDVMVASPETVPADGSVADLRRLFANPHVVTALLVDGAQFAGTIDRAELAPTSPARRRRAASPAATWTPSSRMRR